MEARRRVRAGSVLEKMIKNQPQSTAILVMVLWAERGAIERAFFGRLFVKAILILSRQTPSFPVNSRDPSGHLLRFSKNLLSFPS